ncbi:RDD family protein [Streptomyces mayteni]
MTHPPPPPYPPGGYGTPFGGQAYAGHGDSWHGYAGHVPGGPPPRALANRGVRLLARLLDLLLMAAVVVGMVGWGEAMHRDPDDDVIRVARIAVWVVCPIFLLCYEPFTHCRYGATLGKRLLGLRVARLETGRNLTAGAAVGRWAFGLMFLFTGYVLVLLDPLWCTWDKPYRQCLHDKVATSVVVRTRW